MKPLFQPRNGSIGISYTAFYLHNETGFNPATVRLELGYRGHYADSSWFQPRNGSIGIQEVVKVESRARFQPRNGSIGMRICLRKLCQGLLFQPRNGSIGMVLLVQIPLTLPEFQPRNGSIGIWKPSTDTFRHGQVSTPQRFDWNLSDNQGLGEPGEFQPRNGSIGI